VPVPNRWVMARAVKVYDRGRGASQKLTHHLVALVRAGARFECGHLVERPETITV
jgi:hypothetical protein